MQTNTPITNDSDLAIHRTCQSLMSLVPHEWQSSVIKVLIDAKRSSSITDMLLVRPTSGGKSLVYQVVSYMVKGITLFISPLLALAFDQTNKL